MNHFFNALSAARESRLGKTPAPFRIGRAGVSDGCAGQCPQRFPVAANIFYTLPIIGKILGNRQASTTSRYAHVSENPVATVVAETAAQLQKSLIRWEGSCFPTRSLWSWIILHLGSKIYYRPLFCLETVAGLVSCGEHQYCQWRVGSSRSRRMRTRGAEVRCADEGQ